MKRIDRLNEIERFWKRRPRNRKWEEIDWESFVPSGQGISPSTTDKVGYYLRKSGVIMWSVDLYDIEGTDDFDWDTALLDWLYVWYSLPEEWNDPFFVNERAGTICIPHFAEESFELLFYHPSSVALGMENWEKCQKEWDAAEYERKKTQRRREVDTADDRAKGDTAVVATPAAGPLNRAEALAFLNEEADDEKESGETVFPTAAPGACQINLPPTTEVR